MLANIHAMLDAPPQKLFDDNLKKLPNILQTRYALFYDKNSYTSSELAKIFNDKNLIVGQMMLPLIKRGLVRYQPVNNRGGIYHKL